MPNVVIEKKFTCKGTLRQVFYLSESPSPPMTPYPPPLHTVYDVYYTVIQLYLFNVHTGKGRGRADQREG
jgi:hypothetical protein